MTSPQPTRKKELAEKFRHAKMVCTVGPASRSPEMIDKLFEAGMDMARVNMSHGTPPEHAETISQLRAASVRNRKPIAILADLPGPKIRTGPLVSGQPVTLRTGQRFTISTKSAPGTADGVSTTFERLPREVHRGDRVLLADGLIELRVESTTSRDIITRVVNGGELGQNKGINLPGVRLSVSALTDKDRKDLQFALKCGVNYIGVSFVRTPKDVLDAKQLVQRARKRAPIIAKLEKPEAIQNLDDILAVTDGVMVARGDLGVEMDPQSVPVVQKMITARARQARVPVIIATQMLESMTVNPRPTRAEASDVANAVFDGADAVMLSAETAAGRYPFESALMMDRIIREAESSMKDFPQPHRRTFSSVQETTAELICHASRELPMKVIAVFTETGSTARLISNYRPHQPIIAFSPDEEARRQLALLWGVLPVKTRRMRNIEDMIGFAERGLLAEGQARKGDLVGIVAGAPVGVGGSTNFIRFHVVGGGLQFKDTARSISDSH